MKRVILLVVTVMLLGVTSVSAKGEKICVEHNGNSISVSVNAVPAFVALGAAVGCTAEEQEAFAWLLESEPSKAEMVDAAVNIGALLVEYNAHLVSEYQQYQDATVEEEGEFDEEEGEFDF